MRQNKFIILLLLFAATIFATGCKKFLDVNKNVNDPTTVPSSTLLTSAMVELGNSLAMGSGLSNELAVYTHQMSTREEPDQYGIKGNNFYINDAWPRMYENVFGDLDVIIEQSNAGDDASKHNTIYSGIAKILKAYGFSQFVDVFGDIPFSEFDKFPSGIKQPKFDDDAVIYDSLIKMLNDGIADLKNTTAGNPQKPGNDDLIYKGSVAKWEKAANTIKLKLYTQMRKVKNVSSEVTALLGSPSTLINATSESFMVPYGPLGATDDRNPGFGDYTASQRSNHVSPWFYEIMKGWNPNINTNVVDPRIPYYIYNQLKKTAAAPNDTEYRDSAFVTIYFGSVGQNRDKTQQNGISLFGIYPVGGRYDDGQGGKADASSGTGAAPYRFITYADRLYLEAELINTGVATGDAKAKLQAAMQASMEQVDYVITNFVKPTQSVPALYNTTAANDYITSILTKYDAATTAKKLEYIMTQKWLSSVGSSVDQYTDYRRTGYPVLFDPNNAAMAPGGFVQPPVNGNPFVKPQAKVPVQLSVTYPLSLPWPQGELELNKNAPAQKTPATYKIFWMP